MKRLQKYLTAVPALIMATCCLSCQKPDSALPHDPQIPDKGFVEDVPDTVLFTNAEFIYNGDDIGEASSDGWIIKLYTDMEIDETGAPVGPGVVTQLLLNADYDDAQSGSAEFLLGKYTEMFNSGDFSPGTFVSGYMTTINLPGQQLELADATFYAEVKDGSTEMEYDLIDEGVVLITEDGESGLYSIEGILVGKKYTKRYFKWAGAVEPKNNVPEEVPNSTLKYDLTGLAFAQAQLQDKGDSFYLMDQSYRCLLLYLADDGVDMSSYRPAGNGHVLRLEFLVPWETDIVNDGIPEGTYTMAPRNPDTSMDKDKIVPGAAITGLPDEFAAWRVSGSWYYELNDGVWTQNYARINEGTITVVRGEDGSQTVSYDLLDCQGVPKKITGSTELDELSIW